MCEHYYCIEPQTGPKCLRDGAQEGQLSHITPYLRPLTTNQRTA